MPTERLRVMTYNIWNYNAPWPERRALIADVIRAQEPAVVALQETRHDFRVEGGKGQGEQIAELTGYHPTSAVAQVYAPILRVDEGLTVLTRREPLDVTVEKLTLHPHDRRDENHRIVLGVVIDHSGRSVQIFDTHWSLSPEARKTSAVETARFVTSCSGSGPAVLMGDLNAVPDSPPIQFMLGEQGLDGECTSFMDCWVAAHPNEPGFTYSSSDPVRRIDYILTRNMPAPLAVWLTGNQPRGNVYPSDHLAVVADLAI